MLFETQGMGASNPSAEAALKEVQNALTRALRRLAQLGYDVVSPHWNPEAAARTLVVCKPAGRRCKHHKPASLHDAALAS